MSVDYIEVAVFNNDIEAEIAKGRLVENGIDAVITKDDCGGMMPNFQLTEGVRLRVAPEQHRMAEELLQNQPAEGSGDDERSTWTCESCGEVLESQFTDCWNCGAQRTA
jgi:hypothetical protein